MLRIAAGAAAATLVVAVVLVARPFVTASLRPLAAAGLATFLARPALALTVALTVALTLALRCARARDGRRVGSALAGVARRLGRVRVRASGLAALTGLTLATTTTAAATTTTAAATARFAPFAGRPLRAVTGRRRRLAAGTFGRRARRRRGMIARRRRRRGVGRWNACGLGLVHGAENDAHNAGREQGRSAHFPSRERPA